LKGERGRKGRGEGRYFCNFLSFEPTTNISKILFLNVIEFFGCKKLGCNL
jgi:hypothetical protein